MADARTLVIGGSGYLGRYVVDALRRRGHRVSVLTRDPAAAARRLPRGVERIGGDLGALDEAALAALLAGHDNLVFAAGVDERVAPEGDPLAFYRRENVDRVQRVLEAAARHGIGRVALLNSVFSTLDRLRPELELARHHPYVRSRVEQREMALAVARRNFTLTVLEIPWVFGSARGDASQWQGLIQYVRTTPRLFVLRGGTLVVTAANVGEAAAGAVTLPRRSAAVPVGDAWMSWETLLTTLADLCGRPGMRVSVVPDRLLVQFNELSGLGQRLFRLRSGLDYGRLHAFLLDDRPIDLRGSRRRLGYRRGDVHAALAETVEDVPESAALRSLRRLLD